MIRNTKLIQKDCIGHGNTIDVDVVNQFPTGLVKFMVKFCGSKLSIEDLGSNSGTNIIFFVFDYINFERLLSAGPPPQKSELSS